MIEIPAYEDQWRKRWVYIGPAYRVLHRVGRERTEWEGAEVRGAVALYGDTVCGIENRLMSMPGIISRMGLPRCAKCCDKLGVPRGEGAPFNDKNLKRSKKRHR
jgi:hypothetical protein